MLEKRFKKKNLRGGSSSPTLQICSANFCVTLGKKNWNMGGGCIFFNMAKEHVGGIKWLNKEGGDMNLKFNINPCLNSFYIVELKLKKINVDFPHTIYL